MQQRLLCKNVLRYRMSLCPQTESCFFICNICMICKINRRMWTASTIMAMIPATLDKELLWTSPKKKYRFSIALSGRNRLNATYVIQKSKLILRNVRDLVLYAAVDRFMTNNIIACKKGRNSIMAIRRSHPILHIHEAAANPIKRSDRIIARTLMKTCCQPFMLHVLSMIRAAATPASIKKRKRKNRFTGYTGSSPQNHSTINKTPGQLFSNAGNRQCYLQRSRKRWFALDLPPWMDGLAVRNGNGCSKPLGRML